MSLEPNVSVRIVVDPDKVDGFDFTFDGDWLDDPEVGPIVGPVLARRAIGHPITDQLGRVVGHVTACSFAAGRFTFTYDVPRPEPRLPDPFRRLRRTLR